jgi:RTX calcium-binding nonapeptide repeat (4 copies)
MNRIRPFQLAVPLACLLIVLFPQAGASELKPDTISPTHRSGSEPQLVSDGSGDVVAVWRDVDDNAESIRAAFRPRYGGFGDSETISVPALAAESPRVAMDRLGNSVAVWHVSTTGRDSVVQASIRPAGGAWTAPQVVSDPSEPAFGADVSIQAGRMTAVWVAREQWRPVIQTATRTMTELWTPPATISEPIGGSYAPTVAMDDKGGAVAAWQWWDGSYRRIEAAVRSSDGAWSKPEELSAPGHTATTPLVAMDAAGNAVAAWIRSNGIAPAAQTASRPAGGAWSLPRNLSRRGRNAASLDLAMNGRGDAVVSWVQAGGLKTAFRAPGETKWTRVPITASWGGLGAHIALDEEGDATIVWDDGYEVSATYKPAGEPWQDDYLLTGYGDEDEGYWSSIVTAQSRGNALAAWVVGGANDDMINVVGFDKDTSRLEHEDEGDDEGDDGGDEGELFQGTRHADTLVGTPGNDVFYARGGDDVIIGRGGRDVVYGGPGNDLVLGGRGSDRLFGGPGRDRIVGGRGNDVLVGNSGRDLLKGNRGDDTLRGVDKARDRVFGGTGLDRYRLDPWLDRASSIESRL